MACHRGLVPALDVPEERVRERGEGERELEADVAAEHWVADCSAGADRGRGKKKRGGWSAAA